MLALADVNPDGVEQINVRVPFELAGRDSVQVVVRNNGLRSVPLPVALVPADPGIFLFGGLGIAVHVITGRLVTLAEPAIAGEIVEIYATGLGPVTPPVPSGVAAPSDPLSLTIASPVVTIGSLDAEVLLSSLVPGAVGVYKVAVRVPETIPFDGVSSMTVAIAGRSSPPVSILISIRPSKQVWFAAAPGPTRHDAAIAATPPGHGTTRTGRARRALRRVV